MRLLAAAVLSAAMLAACAVQHRETDPMPTLPALTDVKPLPPPPELPAPEAPAPSSAAFAAAPAPEPAPSVPAAPPLAPAPARAAAPPNVPAIPAVPGLPAPVPAPVPLRKRFWGSVAITTSIVSPAQLMGPALPYSPAFMRLPVYPERLTMAVSWGMLSVGEATLGVDGLVTFNGRPAYHLVSEARSNSFCDTFYPVRDLNESWLDARTLTSLGYSKKLREGHFYRDEWVLYDRDAGTFVARRTNRDGTFEVRTGTIPARVQDILSSVYYTRAQPLEDGGRVIVDVNTPDNWPLVINVVKRETVKVPAGRFAAIKVEPAMRREGLFIQKGKRLQLWLSDDPARRPVQMKVEVFFGHVTAVLREMI